nr:unnamed protein product [Callosobruchus analis]
MHVERQNDITAMLKAQGCFPDEWKRVDLALVSKKGKPDDLPSSYRTICLLDAAGKLLEHKIGERLLNHLTSRGDISSRQFGIRKGKSAIDAIQTIVKIAKDAAVIVNRKRRLCALIALDIKNAFNTVPRQAIVRELARLKV